MRYLITGGLGFIGYHLSKRLLELGHEVIIYDDNIFFSHRGFLGYDKLRREGLKGKIDILKANILDLDKLKHTLFVSEAETLIHLAALPVASLANSNPDYAIEINLTGTNNVLKSLLSPNKIKRFIYTSSSFVYGNFVHTPANELDPTSPIDFYGGTKLCGEILTKVYSQRYGIPYTIIRPSAVYGPTDCNMRVSQLFIENALKGKPLVLENGGKGAVDFTYVEDTAEGFILASLSDKAINQTFNITAGNGRTMEEFANILGKYIPVQTIITESKTIRPNRGSLDITKAKELLGYQPKYQLEDGIPKYLEFVKENLK